MNFLRNFNWGLLAAVLFCLSFWAVLGWALYNGLAKVQ